MTLVAVDAVVDISGHVVVVEVVCIVAAMASRALEDGVVVRVDMAGRAHAAGVAVARRKLCVLRMVKCRARPSRGVVAILAGGGEKLRLCRVARVRRVVVVRLVAADARRRQRRVIAVDMAVSADSRRHRMRTRQREGRVVVIKSRVGPGDGVMAQLAGRGEPRGCVHGIGRARVILLVARVTQGAGQVVVIVDVAIGALPGRYRMGAGQWEASAVVIKGRVQPRSRAVALIAGLREVRRHVAGIRRSLKVLQMARHAGRNGQVVIVVDVAISTLPRRHRMHAGQRKSGAVMVEGRIQPRARVVALVAALGEVRRHVIGIRRPLIVLQVARDTRRAREVVVVVEVAIAALPRRHGMHARQRKVGRIVIKRRV